ncbi:hypothetical protein PSQ40_06610 [Curvibacter sp. HBC61]|uniref:Uncharacterized protein n=1 Tax=Curvibacter cyanobacteriorum TaxID=3026422 RepID=A0ABT5MZL3_9BURK|nr:hypothetical protein [Curvibacter sp. HBC61]MDD0838237.1 hypothetical protein [Curvibacter sp. HBC61]
MKYLHPQSWLRFGLLLALGVLVLAALRTLWPATQADLVTAKARAEITTWSAKNAPLPLADLVKWRNSLSEGLAYTPDDALLHSQLGLLFGRYALQSRAVPDVSRDFYTQAFNSFNRALILRPMSGDLALNLSLTQSGRGEAESKQVQIKALNCRALRYTSKHIETAAYLQTLSSGYCS